MSFLKKIFKSKQQQTTSIVNIQQQKIKQKQKQRQKYKIKQKGSFLTWLCTGQPHPADQQSYQKVIKTINIQQEQQTKSDISTPQTSNTKRNNTKSILTSIDQNKFNKYELKNSFIQIVHIAVDRVQNLLQNKQGGVYAIIKSDEQIFRMDQKEIWLKMGRNEQLNSIMHIRPYFFDKIFMIYGQFGSEFSLQDIFKSKQNIYLKIINHQQTQQILDKYQQQLKKNFEFKPMSEWINKLKITIYKVNKNQIWLNLNQQTLPDTIIKQILQQIGYYQHQQEYIQLQQQIPKTLTLEKYQNFIINKQKLKSKYQGQNLQEFLRNKFIEKMGSKAKNLSPRNQSPRNQQNINKKDTQEYYEEYILAMNANTLPKQLQGQLKRRRHSSSQQDPSQQPWQQVQEQEQIFEFNIYKDDSEQQARRVASSRQRKMRSKSEDIFMNEFNVNLLRQQEQSDYFDRKY